MKRFAVLALVLCMLVTLVACGGGDSSSSAPAASTPAADSSAPESTGEDSTPATGDTLKVALCVTGPVNDGGWCQLAYDGLKAAEEKYDIEVSHTENVQSTEMEAAFTDYAAMGYDLIFGLGFQFGDAAVTVAEKYPEAKYVVFEGNVEGDNILSCKISNEQSRYLLGYLAASLSESGVVGFVAGPEQPSIIKPAEAFKLGARTANPDAKVLITYVESFTDVALGKEAALAMIDQGADVIGHGANSTGNGAIKACEERGIMAMGAASDQNALAPDTVVCSDQYSFGDVLQVVVEDTINGNFAGGKRNYGFAEDVVKLAPYHSFEDKIPAELKAEIEDLKQQIIDGTLVVPVIEEKTD